jgi:hypothetical protein
LIEYQINPQSDKFNRRAVSSAPYNNILPITTTIIITHHIHNIKMASTLNMGLATPSPTPSPTRILKRKAPTENDMFKSAKRTKSTLNNHTFAQEWQKEQQKVRDEVELVPDALRGVILPPKALPKLTYSSWGTKIQYDDSGSRRWLALNGDKARVKNNKHINEAVHDTAMARFPKVEARKREEEKVKVQESVHLRGKVDEKIQHYRQEIDFEEMFGVYDKAALNMNKFMHQCWKCLNYAVRCQTGSLEHEALEMWDREFVSASDLVLAGTLMADIDLGSSLGRAKKQVLAAEMECGQEAGILGHEMGVQSVVRIYE